MKHKKLPKIEMSKEDLALTLKEVPMSYQETENEIKFIQGKVLTVIEASALNPVQLKAVKDIIKHIFSEELTHIYNDTHPNTTMLSEADMIRYSGSVEQFQEDNVPEEYKK